MRKLAKTDAAKYSLRPEVSTITTTPGSAPRFRRPVRSSAVLALAVALMWFFAPLSQKTHAASTHTPWQNMTTSQLSAVWWQWLLSIPKSLSPVIDKTGANAYSGQPYSDLLFLAGTFTFTNLDTGDVLGEETRSINVKKGTALFFPLLNSEADNVCARPNLGGNCFLVKKFPNNQGVPALKAIAAALTDPASGLYAKLTPCSNATCTTFTGPTFGEAYARLQSPPFSFTLPATDNLYSPISVSGTVAPAVADGYYSLIPGTLAPGYYKLEFGGQMPFTGSDGKTHTFALAITYNITVTP